MGKCMVCEGDCFLKASNATRPIQRDDASIVPCKLLEALQKLGQYRIILSADTASEVRQPPKQCLSRKAGIVRYCLSIGFLAE